MIKFHVAFCHSRRQKILSAKHNCTFESPLLAFEITKRLTQAKPILYNKVNRNFASKINHQRVCRLLPTNK